VQWDSGTLPGDLVLQRFPVGPLFMNAYLLHSPSAKQCMLIDPGDDPELLLDEIDATGCTLTRLICTHAHFDHISAAADIQKRWPLPLLMHRDDAPLLERMADSRAMFGFPPAEKPATEFHEGPEHLIEFAGQTLKLEKAPGHCPGHVVLHLGGALVVGDVIFEESIGRTDLPGGSYPILEATILEKIYTHEKETVLHPGHGPSTTVGHEMQHNPFVRP
jgi:hydroxyacylglutathione hydrolase